MVKIHFIINSTRTTWDPTNYLAAQRQEELQWPQTVSAKQAAVRLWAGLSLSPSPELCAIPTSCQKLLPSYNFEYNTQQ